MLVGSDDGPDGGVGGVGVSGLEVIGRMRSRANIGLGGVAVAVVRRRERHVGSAGAIRAQSWINVRISHIRDPCTEFHIPS